MLRTSGSDPCCLKMQNYTMSLLDKLSAMPARSARKGTRASQELIRRQAVELEGMSQKTPWLTTSPRLQKLRQLRRSVAKCGRPGRFRLTGTQAVFRELSAAKLPHEDDPELSATLETCERAVAAFIAVIEEWPEEMTLSTMLQHRVRLSLAKAAVLGATEALLLNISAELSED